MDASTPQSPLPIDPKLIQKTLEPYGTRGTIYLQQAAVKPMAEDSEDNDNDYAVTGQFAIGESCYISETGHFNAVEFNICYNQLFYVTLAQACATQAIEPLKDFTLDDFYQKQLSSIDITRLESFYRRPINSNAFTGELTLWKIKVMKSLIVIKTEVEFSDTNKGLAYGSVDIAIAQ